MTNNFNSIYIAKVLESTYPEKSVQIAFITTPGIIFMKVKVYLTSIFIFLTLTTIHTQNITGNLEGYLVDTSAAPIEGVNILLESKNLQGVRGTATPIDDL